MRQWFREDEVPLKIEQGFKHVACEKLGIPKLAGMALMEKVEKAKKAEEAPKKRKGKAKK